MDPEGWHGRAGGGMGRAKSLTLGSDIFLSHISYFHPESAPNPLSFINDLYDLCWFMLIYDMLLCIIILLVALFYYLVGYVGN